MKNKIIIITLLGMLFLSAAPPPEEITPGYRKMKCGLWMTPDGSIAYKTIAAVPSENDLGWDAEDLYITWAYDAKADSLSYMIDLSQVVDTASFELLGECYFKDKSHIYFYIPMATGGHISVCRRIDYENFRVFKANDDYACDKNGCYYISRDIEGADPQTFYVLKTKDYPVAADKNRFYLGNDPFDYSSVKEFEKKYGIKISSQLKKKYYRSK